MKALNKEFSTSGQVPSRNPKEIRRQKRKQREDTAGSGWFNMKATEMTPEVKQDLKVLRMRSVLDPTRRYKRDDRRNAPKHVQIGTVIASAQEFYSGRMNNKDRSRTFAEEILKDKFTKDYLKKNFQKVQAEKVIVRPGGHGHKSKKRRTWVAQRLLTY